MNKPLAKPLPLPKLPKLAAAATKEDAERNIDQWTAEFELVRVLNDELFEKALVRMKLCSFINAMLARSIDSHFSWCPHEDWDNYWQDQGWPPLPEFSH